MAERKIRIQYESFKFTKMSISKFQFLPYHVLVPFPASGDISRIERQIEIYPLTLLKWLRTYSLFPNLIL